MLVDALFQHNGSGVGGLVGSAPAAQGLGASFSNAAYFEVPDSPTLAKGDSVTFDAWIAPNSSGPIVANITPGGTDGILFDVRDSGALRFIVGAPTLYSKTQLTWGKLTHVAATYDGASGTISIYIDGKLDSTASVPAVAIPTSGLPLRIGADHASGPVHYSGVIDELRVWSSALTAEQVLAQRTGGSCAVIDALRWDFAGAPSSSPKGATGKAKPLYSAPGFSGYVSHTASGASTGGNPWLTSYLTPTDSGPYVQFTTTQAFHLDRFLYWTETNPTVGSYGISVEASLPGETQPDGTGFTVLDSYLGMAAPGAVRGPYDAGVYSPGTYFLRARVTSLPPEQSCWIALAEVSLIGTLQ
jgi:hypothetical protein